MTGLEVIRCGPGASVQDAGRLGHRRLGVSTAGAMDRRALALANALVGNAPDAAAVEVPLARASFRVNAPRLLVAVCGPGATLAIDGQAQPDLCSAIASHGQILTVGAPRNGVYNYLAVAGGIRSPVVLGSRACHRRSGIGLPPLEAGDPLPCDPVADGTAPQRFAGDWLPENGPVRVIPGPQDAHFGADAWERLCSDAFRIDPSSDRMGLRLDGPRLVANGGHDIVSDGVVPGSIQVPGDGRPIVLGRDCQTTGGYPKIATVISADLDRLLQIPPGAPVRFAVVSRPEAVALARKAAAWQRGLSAGIARVDAVCPSHLSQNLISGVTRGDDP
jgi:biotin-dependent carboxylase-like uncharacterized protein